MTRSAPSIEDIYFAALERESGPARAAFLDDACGGAPELRDRIDRMLRAQPQVSRFLEAPAPEIAATVVAPDATAVGTRIGPYKLLEQIGEGGMGVVYVAEQTEPIRRRVALKVIKPGMDSRQVVARFAAERQALALMDHPHIATVLDAGVNDAGLPYFVMELVRGLPITEYCDAAKLTPDQRIELFIAVCQAVQHAHQKGIIHRDLKPSNVLVTQLDGKPIPKVIDFGVAKAIGPQLSDRSVYTGFMQLVGTPLYMSPEQAELSAADIDTRSDVYSLGVLLYELLTGRTPFDSETLFSKGLDEMRRIIREQEPPRPSHRVSTLQAADVSTVSSRRSLDERRLQQQLTGELDWIVMKALEKDRDRRYESASAMAADLRRYIADEPVLACPPSMGYRLRKTVRRHRALLTTAGLLTATLLVGTGVSVAFAIQAEESRSEASQERNNAVAAKEKSRKDLAAALDAIDKLLTHASSPELTEIPAAQVTRKKILEDVLKFYQNFQTSTGNSPALRYRAALTWNILGRLAEELRDYKQSRECRMHAINLLTPLAQEYADAWWYDEPRVAAILGLAYLELNADRDVEAARRRFEQVRDWADALAKQDAPDRDKEFQRLIVLKQLQSREGLATLAAMSGDRNTHTALTQETDRLLKDFPAVQGDGAERHKISLAINLANAVADTDPDLADQNFRKAVAGAREALERDATRFGQSWNAQALVTAASFFQQRDSDFARELMTQAEQILTRLSDDFPEISNYRQRRDALRSLRLELLVQRGDFSEAAEILDKLPAPETPRDCWRIAKLYDCASRDADADQYYERALQRDLEQTPPGLDVRYWLRELAFGQSPAPHARPRLAARWAITAAEKLAADAVLEVSLGIVAYRNQQFDSAITHCNRAMELDPANDEAYAVRSAVYAKQGKYDEALAGYAQALDRNPRNAWSWCDRGKILMDHFHRDRDALADFDQAIAIEPIPHFYRQRAAVHLRLQQYAAALVDFDAVLKSAEADITINHQAAVLALVCDDLPRYREICRDMLGRFNVTTKSAEAAFTVWTCCLAPGALDDYAPVLKLAEQAVAAETPAGRRPLTTHGAVLLRSGNVEQALQVLEEAAALPASPQTSPAYAIYLQTLALQQLGRLDEARTRLEQANGLATEELENSETPPGWIRTHILKLLRSEAEQMLSVTTQPSPGRPPDSGESQASLPAE